MRRDANRMLLLLLILALAPAMVFGADAAPAPLKLKLSDCPQKVQKTFEIEARSTPVETVEKSVEDGHAWYTASVTLRGKRYTVTVDQDGTLIDKVLALDEEKQVELAQCPKAVQRTLKEETQDAPIGKITREKHHGVVSYYARVSIGGKPYWLTVDQDGTLIGKSLDDAADDDTPDRLTPQRRAVESV